jgi:hypothetical protein
MLWSQFSTILAIFRRKKIGVFLINQCYDHIFEKKLAVRILNKKRQYFRRIFRRKYFFYNHNINPRFSEIQKTLIKTQVCNFTVWMRRSPLLKISFLSFQFLFYIFCDQPWSSQATKNGFQTFSSCVDFILRRSHGHLSSRDNF